MCTLAVDMGRYAKKWLENCGGHVRKGMVLVDPKSKPQATWTFLAEIWTIDGATKVIKNNYTPVIHTSHIRQSAKIILDQRYIKRLRTT